MAKNKKGLVSIFALLYLVAFSFFIWGVAAGNYKVFPWKQMHAVYEELHAFFTFQGGLEKSWVDKMVLDKQEKTTEYDFSGLRFGDPDFQDDGYLLISRYSKSNKQVITELFSIASNEVLHTWVPPQAEIFEKSRNVIPNRAKDLSSFVMKHPLLLKDGGLIFNTEQGPMVKIDSCGRVVWVINRHFHHSIEIDSNGNIVACIVIDDPIAETIYPLRDDGFAIISLAGEILKEYSVTDILLKNGYKGLVYGVGTFEEDRIHLNDAQPILRNTQNAQIGDIALSIRNLSTVALVKPDSSEIKWLKTGPWLNQHDINMLENGQFSIFGNDIVRDGSPRWGRFVNDDSSEVYIYDPSTNNVTRPYSAIMARENIKTGTEGRLKILDNKDAYIEQQNYGRILRISQNEIRWEYVNKISDDTVGEVHWSRYIENEDIDLSWMENVACN